MRQVFKRLPAIVETFALIAVKARHWIDRRPASAQPLSIQPRICQHAVGNARAMRESDPVRLIDPVHRPLLSKRFVFLLE
jgi:hypothetical protein